MDCHQTRERSSRSIGDASSTPPAPAVAAHLAECPACRALWARGGRSPRWSGRCRASPRRPVLARQVRALGVRRRGSLAGWGVRGWPPALAAVVVAAVLAPWLRWPAERPGDIVDALIQSGVAEHRRILLELEAGARSSWTTPTPCSPACARWPTWSCRRSSPGPGSSGSWPRSRRSSRAGRPRPPLRYPTSPTRRISSCRARTCPCRPRGGSRSSGTSRTCAQVNGFNVVYWKQQDLVYIMVSGLDREGCQKLYLKMRQALSG